MNNAHLIVACVASVGACIGASYLAERIAPSPPIRDKDIMETTSIVGVPTLTKSAAEGIIENPTDPKEIFNLYIAKTITLENALELLLKNGSDARIDELYKDVKTKRDSFPEDSDPYGYYDAFVRALEKYYPSLKPVEPENPSPPEMSGVTPAPPVVQTAGRRRNLTQKNRDPMIRTIVCADS
jgi:hypothetical protein